MNTNYLSNIDIEQIRRAIQVEEKYKYINIVGKKSVFSDFMLKQLHKIYKVSGKNVKWLPVIKSFEFYPTDDLLARKKSINSLIKLLKSEKKHIEDNDLKIKDDIYSADVSMLKGVGPKFGSLLHKLDILTVFDLITYYPKKYIDYSSRCLIRNLKEIICP